MIDKGVIERVFATDEDLYLRRWHGEPKTLKGLVDYTIKSISEFDTELYTYGDEYGFFAVAGDILLSFGIKKEHRDKKEMFWDSLRKVIGNEFYGGVWIENRNAIRFFEQAGGIVFNKNKEAVMYKFNFN